MSTSFSQWQGGEALPNDGAIGPTPNFRDAKDRRLAAFGATPDAQYPDGYIGIHGSTTRRQDKLLDGVMRQNKRTYSRGVHKGERINQGDYLWPDEFNLMTGLERQVSGVKWAPPGAEPVRLTNDGKVGPRGIPSGLPRVEDMGHIDPQRRTALQSLAPGWK
jgi:hypothetical protein